MNYFKEREQQKTSFMKNEYLGWGLLATVAITLYGVFIAPENGGLQTLMGFGFLFFGIWGGLRLIK